MDRALPSNEAIIVNVPGKTLDMKCVNELGKFGSKCAFMINVMPLGMEVNEAVGCSTGVLDKSIAPVASVKSSSIT